MQCKCDIKALFSVGCKCGGFAAEMRARSSGSSALAAPTPVSDPFDSDISIANQLGIQEQILVTGVTGKTYWVRLDRWLGTGTLEGITQDVPQGGTGKSGEFVPALYRKVVGVVPPRVTRHIHPNDTTNYLTK